ncbi:MATE family efflux transporter [Prodigiosinella aquatilis]|nr:MATE family efflux transporter [Prodigiosinella sp. LS101]WJV55445.1 MATE family efflux transporter [Prodigiosinella sp. LS101]WJV59806.1 MATE family efflux transporter [Pectobacteriaceae bacterium C111]
MTTSKQPALYAAEYPRQSDLRQVVTLAWPMILTAVVVSLSQNGQIWILGNNSAGNDALYLLSMLQPFHFLFIALLECLTITNQIFSARSTQHWPRRNVINSTLLFALVGALFLALIALCSWLFAAPLQHLYVSNNTRLFNTILPVYMLSLIPFLIFELSNAALRGQSKSKSSMTFIIGFILINFISCYIGFNYYHLGFSAVIYSNLIAALMLLPCSYITMVKTVSQGEHAQARTYLPRLLAITADAGVPIFLSMMLAFASSAVIFPLLSKSGLGYATGFLIVVKLRTFFIIPAVAIGSAIAICVNQKLSNSATSTTLSRILSKGLGWIALSYLVFTLLAFFSQHLLVDLLAGSEEIRKTAYLIMAWLLPTFFMTSLVASIQTILEQLGRGKRVLLVTFVMEALLIMAVLLADGGQNIHRLINIILVFNLLYLTVFVYEYYLLVKKMGKLNAV